MKSRLVLAFFILGAFCGSAGAYQDLSAGIGGGYSGNLFADSFNIGNSYLTTNLSFSSTNFQKAKLKLFYNVYYYQYDTGKRINNIFHVPGVALYQRSVDQRFKWGIETFAAVKDYVSAASGFDNYRIFSSADISYYFAAGLQSIVLYRLIRSQYSNYGILDNYEHWASGELVATLPTKTTVRGTARYSVRRFDQDQITYHWIDTELGLSQSIDVRTGLSFSILKRWTPGGERPFSSYFIISGITSYWDPWSGNQINLAIKRILPFAMVSKFEGGYWKREFTYDQIMRDKLVWLGNKSGRRDEGWLTRAELSRQFNSHFPAAQSFLLVLKAGYISNGSDDSFYKYHYFFADLSLRIHII